MRIALQGEVIQGLDTSEITKEDTADGYRIAQAIQMKNFYYSEKGERWIKHCLSLLDKGEVVL